MNRVEVLVIVLAFGIAGVRLYQKYVKRNNNFKGPTPKPRSDSSFSSSSKEDDYEPYSKKDK